MCVCVCICLLLFLTTALALNLKCGQYSRYLTVSICRRNSKAGEADGYSFCASIRNRVTVLHEETAREAACIKH